MWAPLIFMHCTVPNSSQVSPCLASITAQTGAARGPFCSPLAKRNDPKKFFPVYAFFGLASTAGQRAPSQYLAGVGARHRLAAAAQAARGCVFLRSTCWGPSRRCGCPAASDGPLLRAYSSPLLPLEVAVLAGVAWCLSGRVSATLLEGGGLRVLRSLRGRRATLACRLWRRRAAASGLFLEGALRLALVAAMVSPVSA